MTDWRGGIRSGPGYYDYSSETPSSTLKPSTRLSVSFLAARACLVRPLRASGRLAPSSERGGHPVERVGISGSGSVVAHDDPLALDPHDRLPGDEPVRFLSADAEVLEQRTASDAKTGDPKVGRGEFASEVVAAAERAPRFGHDLAAQER